MDQYQWVTSMEDPWKKIASPTSARDTLEIRFLNIKSSELVLDCGTGNGRFSVNIAKMGAHVIGIDINLKMVLMAKRRSTKEKLSKVQMIVADMQNLPFKANTFDKIICVGNL